MLAPLLRRGAILLRFAACLGSTVLLLGGVGAAKTAESGSAEFVATHVVEVRVTGTAHGSVVSIPGGIDCNPSCKAKFREGTEVALVAGSKRESRFVRWTGDCVGYSVLCVVIADRTTIVSAQFEPEPNPSIGFPPLKRRWLYVTVRPAGGEIRSSDGGLGCPRTCKLLVPRNTPVTLRAFADRGYSPQPIWESYPSGICRADRCDLTVRDSDVHVGASFKRNR